MSTTGAPSASSRRSASMSTWEPPFTGTTNRRAVLVDDHLTGGELLQERARRLPGPAPSPTTISMRSPPTRSFSWLAVPWAMPLPWSMTTMSSASRSASSRYWVVSSRVVPALTSSRITSQRSARPRGSSPVVGSSRKSTGGCATRAPARSRRRRMPPEYVFTGRSAASREREQLEQLARPLPGAGPAEAVEASDHLEVLVAGEVLVDRGVLAGQADLGADRGGVPAHVDAGHLGGAGVGVRAGWRGCAPRWSCRRRWDRAAR